jgi:hypothetical protein
MNQNKKREKPVQLGCIQGPKPGSSPDQPNGQQQPSPALLSLSLAARWVPPVASFFLGITSLFLSGF